MTNTAIHPFLHGLVDYAGLFPPAQLDLQTALQKYREYREGDDRWMLGPFIIPAARLIEVELPRPAGPDSSPGPWPFSVLLPATPAPDIESSLAGPLESVREFLRRSAGAASVAAFELPLPRECGDESGLRGALERLTVLLDGWEVPVFIEPPRTDGWRRDWEICARALAGLLRDSSTARYGFKLRCGGVVPEAFPDSSAVAGAIALTTTFGIPFKATAGLHHPVRHRHEPLGVHMHGFVNVFGAALFSRTGMTEDTVREVVEETDAHAFAFREDGLHWRGRSVSRRAIEELRPDWVSSFGSCSFDEPREDLRALGWI